MMRIVLHADRTARRSQLNRRDAAARFSLTSRHAHHGFTLAEMMIVVLIIGIVLAVAQPRFATSLAKQQAITLARQIAKDIDTVRNVARATSATKSITFNVGAKTYTLNGITNPPPGFYTMKMVPSPGSWKQITN